MGLEKLHPTLYCRLGYYGIQQTLDTLPDMAESVERRLFEPQKGAGGLVSFGGTDVASGGFAANPM